MATNANDWEVVKGATGTFLEDPAEALAAIARLKAEAKRHGELIAEAARVLLIAEPNHGPQICSCKFCVARRNLLPRLAAATPAVEQKCGKCYGTGEHMPSGPSDAPVEVCSACEGTGKLPAVEGRASGERE